MISSPRQPALAMLAVAALALSANTQTLYGLDGGGGLTSPQVVELTGSSGGPCGFPAGPFGHAPFAAGAVSCPGPAPFSGAPGIEGDVAVNRYTDTIWAAGPGAVGEYTVDGVQVSGFVNPFASAITGLGMNSTSGRLWIATDNEYASVLPACGSGVIDTGPFVSPHTAPMTDIAWDPHGGRLWACFEDGTVGVFSPGGSLLCSFNVSSLGLGVPLTGLDLDTRTPGVSSASKFLFVTDGALVAHVDGIASCSSGVATLAPADFAFPAPMFAVSGAGVSGLAFAAHGVTYGASKGLGINVAGMAIPGTSPQVQLAAAGPGVVALFVDSVAQCPPLVFKGRPVYVVPTILYGPVLHTGSLSVPAPLPASVPIGVTVHMQWVGQEGSTGHYVSSRALALGTLRP